MPYLKCTNVVWQACHNILIALLNPFIFLIVNFMLVIAVRVFLFFIIFHDHTLFSQQIHLFQKSFFDYPFEIPDFSILPNFDLSFFYDLSLAYTELTSIGGSNGGAGLQNIPDASADVDAGNSTYDTYSSSDSESESPLKFTNSEYVHHLRCIEQILDTFNEKDDIANASLSFIKNTIPNNFWATSEEQIKDDYQIMNQYLTNLASFVDVTDEHEYLCLCHLQAAVSTYNALLLNNYSHESLVANIIYDAALTKLNKN